MTWAGFANYWRRSSSSAQGAEDEIDEELMFHLRSLVDDNLAAGMSSEAAWRDAQDRFGSLRRYSAACREVTLFDRLLSPPVVAAGLLVFGLLVGWLLFEVRTLRHAQLALLDAAADKSSETPVATQSVVPPLEQASLRRDDLAGHILDHDGKPIDDADVLVILKTWPGGRYRQQAFAATSDSEGRFRLPELIPADGQVGLLVAALKDGHALTSSYQLREAGGSIETGDLTLRLDESAQITLVLHDGRGRPVANARVLPSARQSPDGESHLVYFQGSESLQVEADSAGRVRVSCFERGDEAEVYVQIPGQDWQRHVVRIPGDGDVVEVKTGPPVEDVAPPAYGARPQS